MKYVKINCVMRGGHLAVFKYDDPEQPVTCIQCRDNTWFIGESAECYSSWSAKSVAASTHITKEEAFLLSI